MDKEGHCVLIRHGSAFYWMHSDHLKVNEFGSQRNEESKISLNEINEVLEEEDEGEHNKSPCSKSEELKENTEKSCRNAVVEYKMNGSKE